MACWRIIILVAILLFSLGVQGEDYFHCHRKGQDCANSKTCNDDGSCDCGDDYTGDDCGLAVSDKGQSPCTSETDSCGADSGLCYSIGAATACYCPADSYGGQCENKRYTVECTASAMNIMLFPAGTFSGVIYVSGEKNTAGCMFIGPSGTLVLQDESCGNVTTDTATGDRSRVVIVQYNDKYITELDTKLTVTCSAAGAGTVDVTATFSSQGPDGHTKEQAINNTADIDSSAVNFEIKLKDGTSVSSSTRVPLNDQLTFEFAATESCGFTNTSGKRVKLQAQHTTTYGQDFEGCKRLCKINPICTSFDFFAMQCSMYNIPVADQLIDIEEFDHYDKHCITVRVESCTASNGESGADAETLNIIENSCPSSEVGKLMEQDPTPDDDFKVTFKLRPFKFNKNNTISITCTVKVCPTGSAECQPMDCSTVSRANRRKRRSTEISDETLRKTIIIQFPELEQTKASDTSKKTSVNDVTTPLVIGVAIMIILVLVICIVVLLFVKKRRSNRKSQDESVNKQTI